MAVPSEALSRHSPTQASIWIPFRGDVSLSTVSTFKPTATPLQRSSSPAVNPASLHPSPASISEASSPSSTVGATAEEPAIPYTIWTRNEVILICVTVMFAGLFSPMSSSIYFPALPVIASSLNVSTAAVNLTVTTYMIFQGISPMFWASTCDVIGRRPVYLATITLYLAANIGLSFTNVYWLLLVLRCFQSAGSASVVALGSGTIGDLVPPARRGGYMSFYNIGSMLGPTIAPVFGGLLSDSFGWHSIFYFLAAFSFVVLVFLFVFLPETLRSLVGDGSIPARGISRSFMTVLKDHKYRTNDDRAASVDRSTLPPRKTWRDVDLLASLKMFREPDICFLLFFNSVVYAVFYMVITSTSSQFKANYGLNEAQIGLCYLANGGGMIVGSMVNGPSLNRAYRATEREHDRRLAASGITTPSVLDPNDLSDFPIEHARLRTIPWTVAVFILACVLYGWSLTRKWPLAVPLVLQFFIGLASMVQFNAVSTLLVDLYPGASASASAANNLARCLTGAGSTAAVDPMIVAMGAGWAFTLAGLLCLTVTPLLWIEYKYGIRFRRKRTERKARQKEEPGRTKIKSAGGDEKMNDV